MVLNFFQLRNHTEFNFELINSENSSNNYNVGPWDTTSRGDMWLAQGQGEKGVSVRTYSDGSDTRPLLYMWDENWALNYRIGGETTTLAIAVDSSKDFSIDVNEDSFTFVCYNGSFNSSDGSQVTVAEWKDRITNYFADLVSDAETIKYAQQFADDSGKLSRGQIQTPTEAQKKAITNLVAMWDADYLEAHRRQGTLYADGSGWRIDLQDNGAVQRHGMYFYNIAVQYSSGRDNVYAHIMLPVGYAIGRRRIRNAILDSMRVGDVTLIMPAPGELQFVQGIPYNTNEARGWGVQSRVWECTNTVNLVWK